MSYLILEKIQVDRHGFLKARVHASQDTPENAWRWVDRHSDASDGLGVYLEDGEPVKRPT